MDYFTLSELKRLQKSNSRSPEEEWVSETGETPLEFLTSVFRDPLNDMRDRLTAARSVMEYAHKKLASEINVSGGVGVKGSLDAKSLTKLSDEEVDTLLKILAKTE